jgi:hypothetical protein
MFTYETGLSERPHRMGTWVSVRAKSSVTVEGLGSQLQFSPP